MSYTRREFSRLALAGLHAAAVLGRAEEIVGARVLTNPPVLGRLTGATQPARRIQLGARFVF